MEIKACPFCGNNTAVRVVDTNEVDFIGPDDDRYEKNPYYQVVCCMNEDSPIPITGWKQGCGAAGGFRQTKEEAIAAWNKRHSPWVKCSERLPDEPYGCLLMVEEDDYFGEPHGVLLPYFAGYDGDVWNDGDGQRVPFEVTHWMPLPNPPDSD